MKEIRKLYRKLCDEYNNKHIERYRSFQSFLHSKHFNARDNTRKELLQKVIEYAAKDYVF